MLSTILPAGGAADESAPAEARAAALLSPQNLSLLEALLLAHLERAGLAAAPAEAVGVSEREKRAPGAPLPEAAGVVDSKRVSDGDSGSGSGVSRLSQL